MTTNAVAHVMFKPEMARQGDVLLIPITEEIKAHDIGKVAEEFNEDNRVVLAHGEVTGHAHALYDPTIQPVNNAPPERATLCHWAGQSAYKYLPIKRELFGEYDEDQVMLLRVPQRVNLLHEEHGGFSLAPGDYGVVIQQEYDWEGEWRRVAD